MTAPDAPLDMPSVRNVLAGLQGDIAEESRMAHEAYQQMLERHEDEIKRHWDRHYDYIHPLQQHVDQLIAAIARVEAAKPVTFTIPKPTLTEDKADE